ncbi:MAG: flagellar hook capping FlgD N-terminal domain-containing protein [Acidimicrobiales bacterium]
MTVPGIPATSQAGTATGADAASAPGASNMAKQLSTPQLFIKLLVAELQHENPTNPTTPSSILQQTSELSQVEAVTSMATAVTKEQRYAEATDATGLIGRVVTATVTATTVTGPVTGVTLSPNGTPVLSVNGTSVPIGSVTEVSST